MEQFRILPPSGFDYVNTGNPAATTNPELVSASWLNITTGELFFCTDNTVDSNVWIGTLGTTTLESIVTAMSPEGWWDFSDTSLLFTDAGTTNVAAIRDLVYQANDKSGNGNHFIQTTSGDRPQWHDRIFAKRGCVLFDGVNTFLSAASLTFGASASFFIVFQDAPQTAGGSVWRPVFSPDTTAYAANATGYAISVQRDAVYDRHFHLPNTTSEIQLAAGTATKDGAFFILSMVNDNNSGISWVNGTQEGTATGTRTSGFETGYYLGSDETEVSRRFAGYIAEFIVFTRAVTTAERLQLEMYLNSKWQVY